MRIAVTGATGFIGQAVCQGARARGWTVVPFGRRPGGRYWDLTSGPLVDPPRVDAVVHCAAAVTEWGDEETIRSATVDGTRVVGATFPDTRLIHLSSASVYDPLRPSVYITEDDAPVDRYLTAYARAKADAERVLDNHPDVVILRPHAVYGPGDPTLLPRVLAAVRGGRLAIVGDGAALTSLTHVDNLVQAVLLACESTAPGGVYNVSDAEPVSIGDALAALLTERSLSVRFIHIPRAVAWPVATLLEFGARAARSRTAPRLTRYAISHLAMERTLDISKARSQLGFSPFATNFAGAAHW